MPEGIVLCLAGDVMTGRGVDQILPAPGDPRLWEPHVTSAAAYVAMAEATSGPIRQPVDDAWVWGDALPTLREADLRVINLETSITAGGEPHQGKAIHYRMHPANVGCLTAARPDACVLANNHAMDFGVAGLEETLTTLAASGLPVVGAGRDAEQAWRPAVLEARGQRVLLWAVGVADSGVPSTWAAGPGRPGVAYLEEVTVAAGDELGERVRSAKRPGDLAVVSIHWGSNWGYAVPRRHVRFAHRLVDAGVDLVYGHSSHHPRPVEVYRGGLVLYGCGDFVDDYEGIAGFEAYRDDLRLLYVARLSPSHGLVELRMVPFQARKMRLRRAGRADSDWLGDVLDRIGRRFGSRIARGRDGTLVLGG